jgi:hypothetical protein
MKLEFSRQSFANYSNIKLNENPSSGSRVVTCGRTDRQTDVTKLIVAFRNFANASRLANNTAIAAAATTTAKSVLLLMLNHA